MRFPLRHCFGDISLVGAVGLEGVQVPASEPWASTDCAYANGLICTLGLGRAIGDEEGARTSGSSPKRSPRLQWSHERKQSF
jgi:hypothetical protein